jgi:hypothetical protein
MDFLDMKDLAYLMGQEIGSSNKSILISCFMDTPIK